MSTTSTSKAPEDPPTVEASSQPAAQLPGESPQPKRVLFISALAFGQLGLFIALFAPIMIGMSVKAGELAQSDTELTTIVGNVLGYGAIGAFLGNSIFGRLSDRSRSRFGMRRPYMISGVAIMVVAFFLIAVASNVWMLAAAWFVAQFGANAAYGPFTATLADQLPEKQYARVSAVLGIMQNIAIFLATWISSLLSTNTLAMFMAPALVGALAIVMYALVLPDKVQRHGEPEPFRLGVLLRTFWVNPIKHPDFGFAWLSRLFVITANMLFVTFRFPYVMNRLDVPRADVPGIVSQGVLWYTISLIISGFAAGWLSDRLGRRKVFVFASSAIFAIGTYLLLHIDTVEQFYLVEALIGVGYGIYMAIDLALVLQILPNPEDRGKDLGVFNIANALPSSFAPFIGAGLLTVATTAGAPNYDLLLTTAALAALAGACAILPIKKVR
ncbi:MFS transporter [Streptomyces ochraceiscleroticus]|uniref:MFS transporter n=1 Tax=Streptomyces ochraceiscleroticus TaxID=47761 RepID=A0ABW1MQ62_9ACTN|nr:MFS transporter [Streptomyces ochraceiscleroticus]